MSYSFQEKPSNAISRSRIARVIGCKALEFSDIGKWLRLAVRDMQRAPLLTFIFGLIFTLIPWAITYFVSLTGWHLVIMPAVVCFVLIGPFLAAGMYDVSWELEKGHKPSFSHCFKAILRNNVNEWAFGVLLLMLMIFWLRVASLIHALYPQYVDDDFVNLIPFLTLGTLAGAFFTLVVFSISAFTQPILMERRVDLMTAVLTSVNAVWVNKAVMLAWAMVIVASVVVGFATLFLGFMVLMPLMGYASWHAYIDTIETKRARRYE